MNYLQQGKQKEFQFSKFFEKVVASTREQDIQEHWDFAVRYDVKMIKRELRGGEYDENIHWVEIKNVHGNRGWLYGDADFFSFEVDSYWVIVAKETLQEFIKEKCHRKQGCDTPQLYQLYQRTSRKDIITLVKTIDLMFISCGGVKK